MIGSTIMCAALNPNLSVDDLRELCEQNLVAKARMLKVLEDELRKLPIEERVAALAQALPMVLAL